MFYQFSSNAYYIKNNFSQPFAFMLLAGFWLHGLLAKKLKRVIRIHRNRKQYLVYRELSRRQPLYSHVAFQFSVKLFAGGVAMVQLYHFFGFTAKVCPPTVYFYLGN